MAWEVFFGRKVNYKVLPAIPLPNFGCCTWREIGDLLRELDVSVERLKKNLLKTLFFARRRVFVPPPAMLLILWMAFLGF